MGSDSEGRRAETEEKRLKETVNRRKTGGEKKEREEAKGKELQGKGEQQ